MISKNQIKYIQSLHLKKNRDSENVFIVEGVKLVTEFLQNKKYIINQIFATNEFITNNQSLLQNGTGSLIEITYDDLKKISTQQAPNQVLTIVKQNHPTINESDLANKTTLFLDDIRDPGNLGTIIRLADWYGINQVICSPNTTDIYNPKSVQASMGAILRVNIIYTEFSNLYKIGSNLPIYGAVLNGENIYQTTLKPGILIIGNEANGISNEVQKLLTQKITIPAATNNGSESLNAAIACAIICSEFYRQNNN